MSSGIINSTPLATTSQLQDDKANFPTWKILIEEALNGRGIHSYIDGTATRPVVTLLIPPVATPIYSVNPSMEEFDYRDGVARSIIITSIVNPIGTGIIRTGTAKVCWDTIMATCAPQSDAALSLAERLLNEAVLVDHGSSQAIEDHINLLRVHRHNLQELGKTLTDREFKNLIIRSLPATNDWVAITGESDAVALIRTHALTLIHMRTRNTGAGAFAASSGQTGGRQCTNTQCKARNKDSHWIGDCYWPGGGKDGQFPTNFGKRGGGQTSRANVAVAPETPVAKVAYAPHYALSVSAWDCGFDWADEPCGIEVRQLDVPSFTTLEDTVDDDEFLLVEEVLDSGTEYILEEIALDIEVDAWALVSSARRLDGSTPTYLVPMDSGSTNHFMRQQAAFDHYQPNAERFGQAAENGSGFPIVGRGPVTRNILSRGKWVSVTFKNSLHAPALSTDLISVSQLDKAGCVVTFGEEEATVTKDGKELFSAILKDGMYYLQMEAIPGAMLSTSSPVSLCQWHRRLAHGSAQTIKEMSDHNLVDGLKITDRDLPGHCVDCILARQAHRAFDKTTDPDVETLELVAFDLWGPSRVPTTLGKIYMMPVVDSGSGYKHVDFLKDKSDESTMAAFDAYRRMAETQTGKKIKKVRTDNAFNSKAWEDYFTEHGILHETSAPYSSAQNGLAERQIRQISEDMRANLRDAGLSPRYWAYAAAHSVHTRNLMPSRRHPGVIPRESWTGKRQNVSHLRVFGSRCWAKVPTVNGAQVTGGSKIDDHGVECTLLGYASGAGNYIIEDLQGQLYEARDVVFEEGVPHRTLESEDIDFTPVDSFPPNSESAASDGGAHSPGDNDIVPLPPLVEEAINPAPVVPAANVEPPRRSGRVHVPSGIAERHAVYLQHERNAELTGEEWSSDNPVARVASDLDPISKLSGELDDFIALMATEPSTTQVPRSYSEAMRLDASRWRAAMDVEMEQHREKGTWRLEIPPPNANVMDSKWVFDVKLDGDGNPIRDKARLVGKGFTQQLGVDYHETWAAVSRMESICMTAGAAAYLGLHIWQVDFIAAFLNSVPEVDIWMRQAPGYMVSGFEEKACRLQRTIYGTMQGAHDWARTLNEGFTSLHYTASKADPCVRVHRDGSEYTLTATYTDDVWGASTTLAGAETRKRELGGLWDINTLCNRHN